MVFYGLGTGNEVTALKVLKATHKAGTYVLIRDDDAGVVGSENVWFATPASEDSAEDVYEALGGTVSFSRTVKI